MRPALRAAFFCDQLPLVLPQDVADRVPAFRELQGAVDVEPFEPLFQAARPADFDRVHLAYLAQSEMLLERQATEIAPARDFAVLLPTTGLQAHARADRRP